MAKDKEAVKITFKFAPNPFFKNKTLEREDGIDVLYTRVCVCVCVYAYVYHTYLYVSFVSVSVCE